MKKLLPILLSFMLAFAVLITSCGISSTPKASDSQTASKASDSQTDNNLKHLSFTVYSLGDSPEFMNWPLVKEATKKFNFDFKIQQVAWDNWDETTRTLVATDSLPEVLAWYSLGSYSEYVKWVGQDVFKALPDNMSKYPNLEKIIGDYSIFDKLKVNGHLYAFPKVINTNPWNDYLHYLTIYRKDWAKAIGKNYKDVQDISWDDFTKYLNEIKQKDPGKLGNKLVPLDFTAGGANWMEIINWQFNPFIGGWDNSSGEYKWGATNAGSLKGINALKNLYDSGILSKDSYADKQGSGQERFAAGRSAVLMGAYVPSALQTLIQSTAVTLKLKENDFGLMCVKQDDDKFHVQQKIEWWASFAFSNHCSDEIMDRWLTVGNWLLDTPQVEAATYGIPGEDWTKTGETVKLNWTEKDVVAGAPKAYISEQRANFQKFFVLEGTDTWLPGNPNVSKYIVDDLYHGMMNMYATNPLYTPTDYNTQFYVLSKTATESVGSTAADVRVAISKSILSKDAAKEWDTFIKSKEKLVKPAEDELNKAFKK